MAGCEPLLVALGARADPGDQVGPLIAVPWVRFPEPVLPCRPPNFRLAVHWANPLERMGFFRNVSRPVRKSLSIVAITLAWLCANDVGWNAVQVFAWARMFTQYTQSMTVSAALRETFDPAKPCDICRLVTHAKESAPAQAPLAPERGAEKLLLTCEQPTLFFFSSLARDWPDAIPLPVSARTEPVPLPPPRA